MAAWARPACQNFPDGSYKSYNPISTYGGYRGRNNTSYGGYGDRNTTFYDYSGVPDKRAGCIMRAGRVFHEMHRNEQVVLSEQGGINLKYHSSKSGLQLGRSPGVLFKIILLLILRFLL